MVKISHKNKYKVLSAETLGTRLFLSYENKQNQ